MDSGQIHSYYTLFCGVFLYEKQKESQFTIYTPWRQRLENDHQFFDHFNRTYYNNFSSNILYNNSINSESTFKHLTHSELLQHTGHLSIDLPGKHIALNLGYFDVFLFENNVGIFSIKVSCHPNGEVSYEKISFILNHFRNPMANVIWNENTLSVLKLIESFLAPEIKLKKNWAAYIPQLKSYTVIDDTRTKRIDETLEQHLFEVAHILPPNTFHGSVYSPSQEYIKQIRDEKTISVFDNWKAIALFDSFTRISGSFPDPYKSWEIEYFLIYIHCLYTKFQLYQFNNQLRDVFPLTKESSLVRNRFTEFMNDYNLAYISYKFLPNLLYEKINNTLEIQKELVSMELKMSRLNEAHQERKSKQLNSILLILSFLSVISVITDFSQWLGLLGLSTTLIYSPTVAISIWVIIGLLTTWYIKKIRPFE